jgi:hypothetical protein|tara:strand:- start:9 stop:176 length:168 start_codon:yes stop_codon:yes gene_type:complete
MSSFLNIIFKNYSFRQAISAEVEEAVGFLVRNLPGTMQPPLVGISREQYKTCYRV